MKSRLLLIAGLSFGLIHAAAHDAPAPAADRRTEIAEFTTGLLIGMFGQAAAEKMGSTSLTTAVKALLEGNEHVESAIASYEIWTPIIGEATILPMFIKHIQLLINHFKNGGISDGMLSFTSGIMQSLPHAPDLGIGLDRSIIDTPTTTSIRTGLQRISALRCGMALGSNLKMLVQTYEDQNIIEVGINALGLYDLLIMSARRYFIR